MTRSGQIELFLLKKMFSPILWHKLTMFLSNSEYFRYDEQLSQDVYIDYGGYDAQSEKVKPA
jgi:hypothetical protein